MAHQWLRINLSSVIFPFATQLWGRSIIVPQYDQNFNRQVVSSAEQEKDRGIPQAFYMHNAMPTAQGYQAIGYKQKLAPLMGATDFDAAFTLYDPSLARYLFVPAQGKNYIFDQAIGHWVSVSPIDGVTEDTLVTTAFVNGQSYIYYEKIGCFKYVPGIVPSIEPVELTGLDPTQILGITNANGYMIAFNEDTVAWSNLTVPTDFTPSLITGAGGGGINEAKGAIRFCLPITGGFILYCEDNVVAARYTGNTRFPYIFTEIVSSSPVASPEQVSWQANLAEQYAWTNSGLEKVSKTLAEDISPEATDFLSAMIFENFDENTLQWTTTYLTDPLAVKVVICGDRWIVISYGIQVPDGTLQTFDYAIVFDTVLKRWGKLKIPHTDSFDWNAIVTGETQITRSDIAFLQADGTVQVVMFDLSQANANGVLLLGKFQMIRNKFICHQRTDIDNVKNGNDFTFYVIATLDGKTQGTPILGTRLINAPLMQRWARRLQGQNISLLLLGAFNAVSIEMDFTLGGDR